MGKTIPFVPDPKRIDEVQADAKKSIDRLEELVEEQKLMGGKEMVRNLRKIHAASGSLSNK